jgi:hypothetical protein
VSSFASIDGAVTVAGELAVAGAAMLSNTLYVTGADSLGSATMLDVFTPNLNYVGSVLKVRCSAIASDGFKLIEAFSDTTTAVFSVDGNGDILSRGWLYEIF